MHSVRGRFGVHSLSEKCKSLPIPLSYIRLWLDLPNNEEIPSLMREILVRNGSKDKLLVLLSNSSVI